MCIEDGLCEDTKHERVGLIALSCFKRFDAIDVPRAAAGTLCARCRPGIRTLGVAKTLEEARQEAGGGGENACGNAGVLMRWTGIVGSLRFLEYESGRGRGELAVRTL